MKLIFTVLDRFTSEEVTNAFLSLVLSVVGMFTIVCALRDFDWFMESRKAWIFVKLFGRKGARVFYMILGATLIFVGIQIFLELYATVMQ
jgi:small neutral amino acid transporter SnatA (MarC family)